MNQKEATKYLRDNTILTPAAEIPNRPKNLELATGRLPLLGNSLAFSRMLDLMCKFARINAPILIEGETGTGKEMVARSIHYESSRRDQPFVPINCGAFPENLIESELFGHVKGAFTDARTDQSGLVEAAANGTLFLDEVDSLTPRAQVILLRFLQDGTYRPLGARVERKVDVRVIAATNSSLDELVKSHAFRCDLLYRLRILGMKLPALRDREDDAILLANVFFDRCKTKFDCEATNLDQESCSWFRRYSWPGNIRELEGLICREAVICDDTTLRLHLPQYHDSERRRTSERRSASFMDTTYSLAKSVTVEQFERQYLSQLMKRTGGNVTQAARIAGKERRAFGKLLKKHELTGYAARHI